MRGLRTLFAAPIAAAMALTLAGVALAANVYTVGGSSPTPGKPSNARPIPIALNFDFQVEDKDPALRGTPIESFAIGGEGVVTYPRLFPTCTFAEANGSRHRTACRRARVGGGLVQVLVGPSSNRTSKLFCNLKLTLYNLSGQGRRGGMAIRLDAETVSPPLSDPDDRTINCPVPIHVSIKSKFVPVRIGGARADELRFTVPSDLLHPAGLDATVRNTESRITRRVSKRTVDVAGKRRRVGFYSGIACKGRKRTIQATFTAEDGVKTAARTQIKRC
jgi:hypothetical protein